MQKEPKQRATNMQDIALLPRKGDTYKPPADFAVATAIRTDRPITNPRKLQSLDLSISGIPDKDLILSDDWQQVDEQKAEGKGFSARYRVKSEPFDAGKSLNLPVTDTQFAPYLAKALPYLDTTNPSILKTANEIRGEETNLYRIVVSLRDWVAKNMIADPSIGVPRTASDIYNNRRGVCRDYSTLFTALARAAGVPTRVCGGIVYAEGRFFYHAWAECFVGEWVTIDPTLHNLKNPVEYTDATHIKFAQGDVMQMFNTVAVVGKLHIQVNDFAPKE
jgi:transglutaminase-like putative cysteine protease